MRTISCSDAEMGGGGVLFVLGVTFAYSVMLPLSLPWLFGLFGTALEPMIKVDHLGVVSAALCFV